MLSSDEAKYLNGLAASGSLTVPQLEAEKAKFINEKWTRQQSAADKKWQQQWDTYKFNRGEATKTDVWRPLSPQEQAERNLPPGVQFQMNTRDGKIMPIVSSRVIRRPP